MRSDCNYGIFINNLPGFFDSLKKFIFLIKNLNYQNKYHVYSKNIFI
jgi:hypothetical protein